MKFWYLITSLVKFTIYSRVYKMSSIYNTLFDHFCFADFGHIHWNCVRTSFLRVEDSLPFHQKIRQTRPRSNDAKMNRRCEDTFSISFTWRPMIGQTRGFDLPSPRHPISLKCVRYGYGRLTTEDVKSVLSKNSSVKSVPDFSAILSKNSSNDAWKSRW